MTDPLTALTALICEHSGLTGVRAERLARRIVEEWLADVGPVGSHDDLAAERERYGRRLAKMLDDAIVKRDALAEMVARVQWLIDNWQGGSGHSDSNKWVTVADLKRALDPDAARAAVDGGEHD